MAMMAITTSNSIRVKPKASRGKPFTRLIFMKRCKRSSFAPVYKQFRENVVARPH
jgi:hypothetical protein